MAKDHDQPIGSPPAYPTQVHYDAGPVHPASPAPHSASPYNAYGGFNNPSYPNNAHLDPRDANKYGSPAPGGYASPAPGGYGPPGGYYGGPQQMYYGQQGPYPQQGYYQQGPPPQQQHYGGHHGGHHGGYNQRSSASQGICAGLFGALACCCCLDFMF